LGNEPGFSWDEAKRASVQRERGIDLADMVRLFDGPHLEDMQDHRNARTGRIEERIRAVGMVSGRVFVVVYEWRGNTRRLITAWRAGDEDRESYLSSLFGSP